MNVQYVPCKKSTPILMSKKKQVIITYNIRVLNVLSLVTTSAATTGPFPLCKRVSGEGEMATWLPGSIFGLCGSSWHALHTRDTGVREHASCVSEILISPGSSLEYKKATLKVLRECILQPICSLIVAVRIWEISFFF